MLLSVNLSPSDASIIKNGSEFIIEPSRYSAQREAYFAKIDEGIRQMNEGTCQKHEII